MYVSKYHYTAVATVGIEPENIYSYKISIRIEIKRLLPRVEPSNAKMSASNTDTTMATGKPPHNTDAINTLG
jgi:hypothetical protein